MSDIDDTAAWQRLVAADPAGPDPDLAGLGDRVIAAAVRERAGADEALVVVTETPSRRPMSQRLFALAAGVAVVAGVGIGGYVLGARSSPDVVAGDAPVTAADDLAGARAVSTDAAAADAGSGAEAGAAGTPEVAAAPFALSEETIAASPVPKVPQTLAGFMLSDAGIERAALATQLASALGVAGEPLLLPSGDWVVGPAEGSNAVLVIGSSAAVPWSMTNPAPPLPVDSQISEPYANEIARTLFAQIGVPVEEVEWEAVSVGGLITETAWYVTDGERTPLFWRIAFDSSGEIVSASGFAGTITAVD